MNTPTPSQKILAMACGLALSSHSIAADYLYDDLNRLIKVTYQSGKTLHYNYDAAGNLLRITTVIPKYTIAGRVFDQQGTRLGGVMIDIGGHTIVTDANGYYQLTELIAGNYALIATHDQYEFTQKNVTLGKNHPSIHNIVSDGFIFYTIEGHVTDKQGLPLAGVMIEAGGQQAETDLEGYYQLTNLTAGNNTLVATHEKYEFTPLDITIGKNYPAVHDIVSNGFIFYTIAGRVTDKRGVPLAGVMINIGGHTTVTDEKGYYKLTELTAGNYALIATHDQYEFTQKNLTIGKNQPATHNIVSSSLALYTIEGHVTDKNGQPLAGVLIEAGEHTAFTDENGYYQLTDLLANKYTLIASVAKHNFTPRKITVGFNKPAIIDLVSDGLTACLLYAVHDEKRRDTQFFTVNPATPDFDVKLLGQLHMGKDIEALDIHPRTNQLFAAAGDDGKFPGHLYQVNAITGDLLRVGATSFTEINGLSFKSDGSLWGWAEGDGLILINTNTGTATLELSYEGPIEDITWDNQGLTLYGIEQNHLLAYNSQTYQLTEVGCILPGGEVEALEMLPDGRILFSIHSSKTLSIHALDVTSCELVGADISTVANGRKLDDVEGIAWPIEACSP